MTAYSMPMNEDSVSATGPGGKREVRWEVVARTPGLTPAQILAGRLQAEGIPARAWQEGAGRATGLVVGLLGTGHVVVPEEFVDQALEILAATEEEFADADLDDEDQDEFNGDEA